MRTTIVYTILAVAFAGCRNSEDALPPQCRNFQLAMEDESVNIGHHFEDAFKSLRNITNSVQRAVSYARWVDELCKLDIGDLDYMRQAYCIREVLDATRDGDSMVDEYRVSDAWMAVVVDSRLKGLSWGRMQLDRLKPTMPTGSSYDYGKSDEYSRWRYCYLAAHGSYRNASAHIEGIHFDSLCRGRAVSAVARENAEKKIEKFLGRKMWTEDERLRANEAAKADLKAVEARKVGPDLKKLRPGRWRSK